jgi:hypothetical protein
MSPSICRTKGCERHARPTSPYCTVHFREILARATRAQLPQENELRQMWGDR